MTFKIETNKTKEEILRIILNNTKIQESIFDLQSNGEYFRGSVGEDSFKIQRCIGYRNSFLPVIIGTIQNENEKNVINIEMRLNSFVKGFVIFWLSFVILFCIMTPLIELEIPYRFIPHLILIFGILLFTIPFEIEAKIAREKLEAILK